MGKGSKPTIGFWYKVAYHHGITSGPIDAFLEYRGGDKIAWQGELTESGTIQINASNLWGGEKDQGGIEGPLAVMFGEQSQNPHPYLVSTFGPKTASWRGFTTVAFLGGFYGAMNPYPKPPSYKFRRIKQGWDTTCWYPEKAEISLASSSVLPGDATGWQYQVLAEEANPGTDSLDIPVDGWTDGGQAPFGNGVFGYNTNWPEHTVLWVKRSVSLPAGSVGQRLKVSCENGCMIYINGVPISAINRSNEQLVDTPPPYTLFMPPGQSYDIVIKAFDESSSYGAHNTLLTVEISASGLTAINPAHVLYDSRTCLDMGRELTSSINEASLKAAADKLYAEGFGICPKWDPASESVEDFEKRICTLIGASFTRSLEDGQWYLDLARGDYNIEDLPILNDDDILDFKEQPSIQDNAINSVSARYFDPQKKETIVTPPVRALGLVAAFGTIHQTNDCPEIPTAPLATRVAERDVLVSATPTRAFDLVTTRRTYNWRPNTYFRLQSPKRGIADMVCVVGDRQAGTLKSGAIKMKAVQDISRFPDASFVQVEPGVDPRPAQSPIIIMLQRVIEAPYVEVVSRMPATDAAALDSDAAFVLAMAVDPSTSRDFTLQTALHASGAFVEVGNGEWCPTATIIEGDALTGAAPATSFTLAAGDRLDTVTVGSAALWDDEIVRVDAIDAAATPPTLTLGRSCADTVPTPHAAGSRIYFYDNALAYGPTEFTAGESIDARLLSNTGSAQLDPSLAEVKTVDLQGRLLRPYPPGKLRIAGTAYPATVAGSFTVTWAHRNRETQADQLVDSEMASITPAPNTRYTLRFLDADGTLLVEQAGIGPGTASVVLNYTGDVTLELFTVDDVSTSLQKHVHVFAYTPPTGTVVTAITATAYTPEYDGIIVDGGA